MKFDLIDWSAQDLHCFDELAPLLHTERGSGGLPLRLRKADTPGCMMQNGEATVLYSVRAQIWRELGILCGEAEHSDSFFKKEVPCYKDLGVMLDCSRNGVIGYSELPGQCGGELYGTGSALHTGHRAQAF